jgi:raffinose/stachyose/melibiose transport system substrate-binding protein
MKKIISMAALAAITAAGLVACGDGGSSSSGSTVYFLNFKPEVAQVYDAIAADYKKEKGVEIKVVTAASGTYEQTLKSEIAKSDAPTIFQINGPVGYQNWKEYTADLSGTELYKALANPELALKSGEGVYGIPYAIEGFGIIYNDAVMRDYFALADKKVSISSAAEITSFRLLKEVVEDMTAHKADLGIDGVFSSTSLTPGEDWRWQTHLADVPLYYEFKADGVDWNAGTPAEVKFTYADNYRDLFDLYLNNSVTEKGLLGAKSVDDSMAEFALGRSAMVQNGNWAWGQIGNVSGNTVVADDVKFLPLFMGVAGEESQGICIGTENYLAINTKVSEEKQKASADFLYWLFSSETGKKYVSGDLGFIAPFNTFTTADAPVDPLAQQVIDWQSREGVNNVPWVFVAFPGQQFKDDFGGALLQYAQGQVNWDDVRNVVITKWKEQAAAQAAG